MPIAAVMDSMKSFPAGDLLYALLCSGFKQQQAVFYPDISFEIEP